MFAEGPPRLRPGDRPFWWDASRDRAHWDEWRTRSRDARLELDVWVSLLLDFSLLIADLGEDGHERMSSRLAEVRQSTVEELAPAGLRVWIDALGPGRAEQRSAGDELPELVIPTRLALRLDPNKSFADVLVADQLDLALACDYQAARTGRTMTSWALSVAIQPAPRSSGDGSCRAIGSLSNQRV